MHKSHSFHLFFSYNDIGIKQDLVLHKSRAYLHPTKQNRLLLYDEQFIQNINIFIYTMETMYINFFCSFFKEQNIVQNLSSFISYKFKFCGL